MNSRFIPADSFPEDLVVLDDVEVQVLHSRLRRQLDYEYDHHLGAHPETMFRHEEILEELNRRDAEQALREPLDTSMVVI